MFEAGAADGAIGDGQKFPCVGLGDAVSHQNESLRDRRARLGHITKADLSMANLSGANLSGVDLGRSDLGLADLTEADLHGATLTGVIGADFTGALNVPARYLKS